MLQIRKGYRQGEVAILRGIGQGTATLPAGCMPVPDNVIIEGEQSGHKHEVKNGKLYYKGEGDDKKMFLQAQDNCEVIHPEHKPIKVPKGLYEIRIQKELKEGEAKKVKD